VALNTIKQNNNIDQRMNKKHGMPHTNTFYWLILLSRCKTYKQNK
jgi:hypothetical protein